MREHARYDDEHPLEALEIIKLYANTHELQDKVRQAAKRSLEYLFMALVACYTNFSD
jgi:pyrroloquinoline quinone (PQQ) biosynthesis protein C